MNNIETLKKVLAVQKEHSFDFVLEAKDIEFNDYGNINISNEEDKDWHYVFKPSELFESQLCEKLGIPAQYYKRLKSSNIILEHHASGHNLLSLNVNGWLWNDKQKKYLIRTFRAKEEGDKNIARAFLSDRYSIIDNIRLLEAVDEVLEDSGELDVVKAELSETRMYLHIINPKISSETKIGQLTAGLVITNSEVGKGAFEIHPRAVLFDGNGVIMASDAFRKIHISGVMNTGEIIWTDEVNKRNREVVRVQTENALKTFLSQDYVDMMAKKIDKLEEVNLRFPLDTCQNVCKELGLSDEYEYSVLSRMIREQYPQNALGIFKAVTIEAMGCEVDKQNEIEAGVYPLLSGASFVKKFDKQVKK